MSSYVMRRKSNDGYKWYLVTPKTVDGKLKRGTDLCLGSTEEAEAYLKSKKSTPEGKELYRKFRTSVEAMNRLLRKQKRKPERYLIKSVHGYYGGSTSSFDKPIKWVKDPKWACKYTSRAKCAEAVYALLVLMRYEVEVILESSILNDNNIGGADNVQATGD